MHKLYPPNDFIFYYYCHQMQRFIRGSQDYIKSWTDKKGKDKPSANMGPCTLSFKVIAMMNDYLMCVLICVSWHNYMYFMHE
jgi:hypothetical protein